MIHRLIAYARQLIRRRRIEAEADEELRFHVEMETEANRARGLPLNEARRAALREFGGLTQAREGIRAARMTWIDSLFADLRYSLKWLTAHRSFSAMVTIVLALGIAVNVAFFSVVNSVLLRDLPVPKSEAIGFVYARSEGRLSGMSLDDYRQLVEQGSQLGRFALHAADIGRIREDNGETTYLLGEVVSANYFEVLQPELRMGAGFTQSDDSREAEPVVVISEHLWQTRFGSDPSILGKLIKLSPDAGNGTAGRNYRIVGVTKSTFRGVLGPWRRTEFFVPFLQRAVDYECTNPRFLRLPVNVVVRLADGASFSSVQGPLTVIGSRLANLDPILKLPDWTLIVHSSQSVRLPFDPAGKLIPERLASGFMAVSGVVLIVASANLAALLMARLVSRRSDMALRAVLGAQPARIMRQIVLEMLVLSVLGTLLAVASAPLIINLIVTTMPTTFGGEFLTPVALDVPVDGNVLLFSFLICFSATCLIAVVPAYRAAYGNRDLLSALQGLTTTTGSGQVGRKLRYWVLVPQMAFSMAMLLVAGSMARGLIDDEAAPAGYKPSELLVVSFESTQDTACGASSTSETLVERSTRRQGLYRALVEAAISQPGVRAASLSMALPTDRFTTQIFTEGGLAKTAQRVDAMPNYLDTIGARLLAGRDFGPQDMAGTEPVMIVDEDLGRALWPNANPVGRLLSLRNPALGRVQWARVIGVVGSVRPPLAANVNMPAFYLPLEQGSGLARYLLVRTNGSPDRQVADSVISAITKSGPGLQIREAVPLAETLARLRYPRRLGTALVVLCAALALVLASVGTYGIISYAVQRRRREIAIRMALGATGGLIVRHIVRDVLAVVCLSIVLGCAIAWYGLVATKTTTILSIDASIAFQEAAILVLTAAIASFAPAVRAARLNPLTILKDV